MNKLFYLFITLIILLSCKKEIIENTFEFSYSSTFPTPVYDVNQHDFSYSKFNLGRTLFYDPILSVDSTISCGSCHEQVHAFAGHGGALSEGVFGQFGTRNSPSITNNAWIPKFMWDGGINHIEVMPIAPITNPVEMHETLENVLVKLKRSTKYQSLFKKAFGNESITDQQMLKALSSFMAMIVSDQSKYDKVMRGETNFTNQEAIGYQLFNQKCASCHSGELFTDFEYRNNGLDQTFSDIGRGLITQNPQDYGKFKTPSLRNIELTYPYMHDGRFYNLTQVLDHYSTGIQQSATLDQSLQNGIALTNSEKTALIAFLKTLTDYELLTNRWLSEPRN
ncbi:MAG: c-type cytochrome [Fluviicola sp.]|nr:c-type cytochrome [Fluviicola sp.]MBP6271234.1 c-type cytochrome [Fluviicola sp.]